MLENINTNPGTDLVPAWYHRQAIIDITGMALRNHDSALTSEKAERINNELDVVTAFGAHGIIADNDGGKPRSTKDFMELPTQKEYTSVGEVVGHMEPGDVLCVEVEGFTAEDIPDPMPYDVWRGAGLTDDEIKAIQLGSLERLRQNYQIDAWSYAIRLAHLKGIRVVSADADAIDIAAQKRVIDPATASEDVKAHAKRRRELSARNIVKDEALAMLDAPKVGPPDRKPQVVLLYGSSHKDPMLESFHDIGLKPRVVDLYLSTEHERFEEQIAYLEKLVAQEEQHA